MKTLLKVLIVLVVAVLVGAIAVLESIDFDRYRGVIAREVEAATGRELLIRGHIEPHVLSLTPSLAIDDVAFANAPWGTRPEMVTLKRLEVEVALVPLLSGNVEVKRLVLLAPDILLETDAEGNRNWVFEDAGGEPSREEAEAAAPGAEKLPAVTAVRIEDATLTYRDGRSGKATTVTIERLSGFAESAESPLVLDLSGTYNGAGFEANAELGALARLGDPEKPYPVSLEAKAGGADISVTGTIHEPLKAKGLDLMVSIEGTDLAALGGLIGASLPNVGAYRVSAKLGDEDAAITIDDLEAQVGESDVKGDIVWVRAEKPSVRAELASSLLVLSDFIGAKASKGKAGSEEPAPGEQRARQGDDRIFSDEPLPLEALNAVDAEVTLTAARIVTGGPALSNVTVKLVLEGGKLTMTLATADLAKGRFSADVTVDAGATPALVSAHLSLKDLDLAALTQEMGLSETVAGKASFEADVTGHGGSVRALMASLAGRTDLVVGESRVRNAYLRILLADATKVLVGEVGEDTKVNCAVSRFDINAGRALSRAMVMDTETLTLTGSGEINLATEELDLTLTPKPKEVSLVNLAVPLKVTGRLSSPTVLPDPTGVAKKAATGVIGAMTGVGLVGGLLGGAAIAGAGTEDNPCLALLGSAGGAARETAAPAGESTTSAEAEGARERANPAEILLEGIGDGIQSIGRGIKGLFE